MAAYGNNHKSTDYQLLSSEPLGAAPPSYDDVVGNDPIPSAPPPGVTDAGHHSYPSDVTPSQAPRGSRSSQARRKESKLDQFIGSYTSYSIPHNLRKHMMPQNGRLDPELDVEAHFAHHVVRNQQAAINKQLRLQCISGWLWCFGVIQILVYLALPVGMLVIGGIGFDDCPGSNNIIIYLLLGGSVLVAFVLMRIIPSMFTCCKNRNYFNSRNSDGFAACICVSEVFFYLLAVANLVILILGTVWIFDEKPANCSDSVTTLCCSNYVYVTSAFFNIFQYVMFSITTGYLLLVFCCVKSMDKQALATTL